MHTPIKTLAPAFALIAALGAAPSLADALKVEAPWARATPPGAPAGGVFMNLTADADMKLVGAESAASKVVELHTMKMENNVMVMRPVSEIALPKGKTVELKPGGLHVMLIGLKAPLKAGDKAALTLRLRDSKGAEQKIAVQAEVRATGAMADGQMHHH